LVTVTVLVAVPSLACTVRVCRAPATLANDTSTVMASVLSPIANLSALLPAVIE
jgi:hypothetical protein